MRELLVTLVAPAAIPIDDKNADGVKYLRYESCEQYIRANVPLAVPDVVFIQPKFAYPLPSVLTTLFATLFLAAAPKPIPPNKVEFAAVPVVLSLPLNEVVTLPAKSESSPKAAAI